MDDDFNFFVDSLILSAADKQTGASIIRLDFITLCNEVSPNHALTWQAMAIERIRKLGLGKLTSDSQVPGGTSYKINATGIAHAAIVRKSRRKPSCFERIRALPVGKGIWEIAKLVIAALLGALAKTYLDS